MNRISQKDIIRAKENNEFIKLIEKFIIQSKTNNLKKQFTINNLEI